LVRTRSGKSRIKITRINDGRGAAVGLLDSANRALVELQDIADDDLEIMFRLARFL